MVTQETLAKRAGIARSSVAVHVSNLMKKGHIVGKGYILPEVGYVAVAGAVNVDIGGRSAGPLVGRDSNPGTVTVSMGGVGRNIAHNLRMLGVKVSLLTALGEDPNAGLVTESCQRLGIDLSRALHVPGGTTSSYLFLSDETGDMVLAVSDMDIYEKLTPAYFAHNQGFLNGASLVVADANLPAEALEYLASHCTAPLLVDPVSTVKSEKIRPILGRIHTLKPNRLEAESLSGVKITDRDSARQAAKVLLGTGLQRVFISLGEQGRVRRRPRAGHLAALLPGPAQERHRRRGRLCRRPGLVLPGGEDLIRERPRRQRRRRCGGGRKDHQPRYVRGRSPAADAGTGGI